MQNNQYQQIGYNDNGLNANNNHAYQPLFVENAFNNQHNNSNPHPFNATYCHPQSVSVNDYQSSPTPSPHSPRHSPSLQCGSMYQSSISPNTNYERSSVSSPTSTTPSPPNIIVCNIKYIK